MLQVLALAIVEGYQLDPLPKESENVTESQLVANSLQANLVQNELVVGFNKRIKGEQQLRRRAEQKNKELQEEVEARHESTCNETTVTV